MKCHKVDHQPVKILREAGAALYASSGGEKEIERSTKRKDMGGCINPHFRHQVAA